MNLSDFHSSENKEVEGWKIHLHYYIDQYLT